MNQVRMVLLILMKMRVKEGEDRKKKKKSEVAGELKELQALYENQ